MFAALLPRQGEAAPLENGVVLGYEELVAEAVPSAPRSGGRGEEPDGTESEGEIDPAHDAGRRYAPGTSLT